MKSHWKMITEDSRYSGMSDGEWHRMWIRGSANSFATPSLKLRRPRDLRLEAVPHHKIHYVQTAINQVIIFQTSSFYTLLFTGKNWVLIHQGYDTQISVYNGNGSEECIGCELEGVANGFATPSLKLRSRRTLGLRRCLTTMSIM